MRSNLVRIGPYLIENLYQVRSRLEDMPTLAIGARLQTARSASVPAEAGMPTSIACARRPHSATGMCSLQGGHRDR